MLTTLKAASPDRDETHRAAALGRFDTGRPRGIDVHPSQVSGQVPDQDSESVRQRRIGAFIDFLEWPVVPIAALFLTAGSRDAADR